MNSTRFSVICFALGVLLHSAEGRALVPVTPAAMKSILTLVNANAVDAHATVNFYADDGKFAASSPYTLRSHGAVSVPIPVAGFEGSAGVASDQPLLALVANSTADNKAREIYEGMETANKLSFPLYRHLGSAAQSSIISIQNPSTDSEAKTTLRYFDENGDEQGSVTQTLAPSARYDFDSAVLFGSTSHIYTVQLEADSPVTGVEQVRFLRDTAAMSGLTGADKGKRLFVNPVWRVGGNDKVSAWSEIYVQNTATVAAQVTVVFYTDKGVKHAELNQTIAASGFALFDTRTLLLGQFKGYAVVNGSVPVAVQWLAIRDDGRRLAGFNAIEQGKAGAAWACTDIRRIMKRAQPNSLQILNTGKIPANIQFEVFAPNTGASLTKKSYVIKQRQMIDVKLDVPTLQKAGANYSALALIKGQTGAKLTVTADNEFQDGGDAGFTCQAIPSEF